MSQEKAKGKWGVLSVLAMAAFIMVIDSTAMNVSMSNLVADLDTDISTIRTIMSMYTLIMAVFMLPGAKIADIFGKKKIFIVGVCLYGVGTLTAALSLNTGMLFVGWAVIEGLASSLMMPTAMSLITSAYTGRDRAVAMSIYAAMGSVALAIGPIFGGLITTLLSWRFVFALEVLIVLYIILRVKVINAVQCPGPDESARFDLPGTALSMLTLFCVIAGALLSSTYGWFTSKAPFTLLGVTLENISITLVLFCGGAVFLLLLVCWLTFAKKHGRPVLIDLAVFKSRLYDSVLMINFSVQLCMMAIMFVVSIYLQNVLRYDAFHTGLSLMPMSILLFFTSLVAVRVAQKVPVRFVIAFGGLCLFGGAFYMLRQLLGGGMVTGVAMIPAMSLWGMGIGCTLSLTGNIGLSDLAPQYANQASGMITTINNFGSSMSTAVFGSVLSGGIGGGILNAFVSRFPETFGSATHGEAADMLRAGFEKMRVMQITVSDLPPEQAAVLGEVVVHGVDNAMLPIFAAIMVIAIVASLLAIFRLKVKKA